MYDIPESGTSVAIGSLGVPIVVRSRVPFDTFNDVFIAAY